MLNAEVTYPSAPASNASAFDVPRDSAAWSGPGVRGGRRRQRPGSFRWRRILWSLLYPRRRQRILPTIAGVLLITLAAGIGVAAYNSANNILFITLSLLLSCLILSGVLSWLNFAGIAWRLAATPPFRVGQTATAAVELRNFKRLLPTYGLWFDVRTTSEPAGRRLTLRERLEPGGGDARVEWAFRPARRGRESIDLTAVGSMFPFGFLRKSLSSEVREEALVWPAPVEYQRFGAIVPARQLSGESAARLGHSGDLFALRRYAPGDSHRLIHWKASARLRTLMVRQLAAENQELFSLWLEATAARWPRAEQFELLCSFAATLAEDLFTAGRLGSVAINAEPAQAIRGLRDLEAFLDRVALLEHDTAVPERTRPPSAPPRARRNRLTFVPEGARGVAAYVDGHKAAAA